MRLFYLYYNLTSPVTLCLTHSVFIQIFLILQSKMPLFIILSVVYFIGYVLSYSMLKIDQLSENKIFTTGDKAMSIFLSLLSYAMILFILISTWVIKINKTGYWQKPLKQKDE